MNIKSLLFNLRASLSIFSRRIKPIRGLGNILKNNAICRKVKYNISGNNNTIEIENGMLINLTIYIRGDNNCIKIHRDCTINNSVFWIENNNCLLEIGSKTTIEGARFGLAENGRKINLGEDCMLSDDIYITTTDSHSIIDLNNKKRINPAEDVVIGNHVWIGKNVTVLKGSIIQDNVIIGTSSVVNKSLESNCIYAGIPAKKVKENITWKREKI